MQICLNMPECETFKTSQEKIALQQKSAKRIYSTNDFYNICRSMKNNEVSDPLLKKLVALKAH